MAGRCSSPTGLLWLGSGIGACDGDRNTEDGPACGWCAASAKLEAAAKWCRSGLQSGLGAGKCFWKKLETEARTRVRIF